jgi:hypothetical protein
MKTLRGLGVAGIMLACGIALGQGHVGDDPSQEVIKELMAQLPKRIKTGKQLPPFVKEAIKELARRTRNKVEVETLHKRLVVITDMDRYLDHMRVTDPKLRDRIKRRFTAFTINEEWPIYINGESDLYVKAEQKNAEDSVVCKWAAVLWHEMVHAQGEADEAIATQEEIRILERPCGRGLVELEWVIARKAMLAQIRKGQVSGRPFPVTTSKP